MLVATWNVNSIKTRLERALAFLASREPDVLCLQELKCDESSFPFDDFRKAGYHAAIHSQPSYNGVAVISKDEPIAVRLGFDDDGFPDPHRRLITATFGAASLGLDGDEVTVINGYFPNGGSVDSDKWLYKLDWMDRLRRRLHRDGAAQRRTVVVGDFNVAPTDADVAHPKRWRESVLCAEPARRGLHRLTDLGFQDCFRALHPVADDATPDPDDRNRFSWWDYRNRGWENNDGLRIDHVFASEPLADAVVEAWVDSAERAPDAHKTAPSDHAPVLVRFAD